MEHKRTRRGKALAVGCCLVLGYGLIAMLPARSQSASSSEQGKELFSQSCAACHSIGQGDRVGPDLEGVVEARDRAWLVRWLMEPDKVLAEGDATANELLQKYNNIPMPNLGLTQAKAESLIAYLKSLEESTEASGEAAEPSPDETALPKGDASLGQRLFTGSLPFQRGGPSCMSCHSIAGNGALGGGTLGPDLTKVHNRYGDVGLVAVLQSLPFPTMQGVFGNKPLSDEEVANLYAYFLRTDEIAPQPVSFNFVWAGLAMFGVLSLLGHWIWRKRLDGVRKPLLGGTK